MDRQEVIARLKSVEPALRMHGVGSLYLFGSFGRDEGGSESDVDVFVDAGSEAFYDLSNFMGAYADLQDAFPGRVIGYSTRSGLSEFVREDIEQAAIRVF